MGVASYKLNTTQKINIPQQKNTKKMKHKGSSENLLPFILAWSRSPVYMGHTELGLFIRQRLKATCLFSWPTTFTFFSFGRKSLPTYLLPPWPTLVCLVICLTCVSMMTQHKKSPKSEQTQKGKGQQQKQQQIAN